MCGYISVEIIFFSLVFYINERYFNLSSKNLFFPIKYPKIRPINDNRNKEIMHLLSGYFEIKIALKLGGIHDRRDIAQRQ